MYCGEIQARFATWWTGKQGGSQSLFMCVNSFRIFSMTNIFCLRKQCLTGDKWEPNDHGFSAWKEIASCFFFSDSGFEYYLVWKGLMRFCCQISGCSYQPHTLSSDHRGKMDHSGLFYVQKIVYNLNKLAWNKELRLGCLSSSSAWIYNIYLNWHWLIVFKIAQGI